MFKRFIDGLRTSFQGETLSERWARILPGIVYGAIAATVYALTLTTINAVTYPGLHLAIDWGRVIAYWLEFGLALAFAGAIVGWFTETYMGIIGGGVVLTLLLFFINLIISLASKNGALTAAISVVTAVPLIGASILLAAAIRYTINRHLSIKQEKKGNEKRKQLAGLVAIVIIVGWIPGFLSRYDSTTIDVIKALNDGLTNAATDPSQAARFTLEKLPSLQGHFGMSYKLYPRISTLSTGSMDITVRFLDGYTFTCETSTVAGAQTYFTDCNEGDTFISQ